MFGKLGVLIIVILDTWTIWHLWSGSLAGGIVDVADRDASGHGTVLVRFPRTRANRVTDERL